MTITPTYSGCPAMREIAADVQARLDRAGFERVTVATQLAPAVEHRLDHRGRAPQARRGRHRPAVGRAAPDRPGPADPRPPARRPRCPRCGSPDTRLTAQFSATACKSLHRCNACGEPFEGVKAL